MAKSTKRTLFRKTVNGYKYAALDAELLESDAYRYLTPIARALLIEFQIIYRPNRNGILSISTAHAAKRLNVTENTVKKPFYMLVEHGFIVLTKGHIWKEKMAREWRLTFHECHGRQPTDDWKKWNTNHPLQYTPLSKKTPTANSEADCLKNSDRSDPNFQAEQI